MKTKDLAAHWRSLLEERGSPDHPLLDHAAWQAEVQAGDTRLGYAHIVADRLFAQHELTPVPDALKPFKPKGKWTPAAKATIAQSLVDHQVLYDPSPRGQLWWAMVHCFEQLLPFIVIRQGDEWAVALDTPELRGELEGAGVEVIYEFDGAVVPRYGDL